MQKTVRFYQLLEQQLNSQLSKTTLTSFTSDELRLVRNRIKDTIEGVFSRSRSKLSSQATVWLANQFFKRIRLSDGTLMTEHAIVNDYSLGDLTVPDLKLLHDLFSETEIGSGLSEEMQKRKALS